VRAQRTIYYCDYSIWQRRKSGYSALGETVSIRDLYLTRPQKAVSGAYFLRYHQVYANASIAEQGGIMIRKLFISGIISATLLIGLPFAVSPATSANAAVSPQIRIQFGTRRRYRHRRYDRDRDRDYNRYYRRAELGRYRLVPQVYWMDGRRYVRYTRVYY